MLVTDGGQLIRCPVHDIRKAGRSTQGVIVIDTAEDEHVVSVEHITEEEEGERGLMALDLLLAFAGACALLFLKPGPAMSVIVANSVGYGVRGGLVSVAGNVLGFVLLLTIVGFGLSWIAETMRNWFDWIRLGGAIYLIWLGISRSAVNAGRLTSYGENPTGELFRDGFLVAVANPEVLLFLAAFLPPFVDPQQPAAPQILALSAIFIAVSAIARKPACRAGGAGAAISVGRQVEADRLSFRGLACGGRSVASLAFAGVTPMTLESFIAFCAAAAALAFVPGPTVTVIIANSLRFGARAGMMNVLGTQAGFVIWLGIAALGLGAAIQLMGIWFDVLRYAGAAYLVWLAIKLFRSKGDLAIAVDRARPKGSFFLQGFIVIISNPKMLVLFGAMIPPFITPGGDPMQQICPARPHLHGDRRSWRYALCPDGGQGRLIAVALAHPGA